MPFLSIVQAALASDRSLTFQATPFADEACETSRSLGRMESCPKKYSEEFFFSHCSQPFLTFRHVTCVLRRLVWASAEWQRQATTGEGESGPVKTGVRFFFLVAKATPIKCLVSGPPPTSIFENTYGKMG